MRSLVDLFLATTAVVIIGTCQLVNCQNGAPVLRMPDGRVKQWWVWEDGITLAGKCGPEAPLINGATAECDPLSEAYYCCSKWGYCGSSAEYCNCPECVNYKQLSLVDPRRQGGGGNPSTDPGRRRRIRPQSIPQPQPGPRLEPTPPPTHPRPQPGTRIDPWEQPQPNPRPQPRPQQPPPRPQLQPQPRPRPQSTPAPPPPPPSVDDGTLDVDYDGNIAPIQPVNPAGVPPGTWSGNDWFDPPGAGVPRPLNTPRPVPTPRILSPPPPTRRPSTDRWPSDNAGGFGDDDGSNPGVATGGSGGGGTLDVYDDDPSSWN